MAQEAKAKATPLPRPEDGADDGVEDSAEWLRREAERRPSERHLKTIDDILKTEVGGHSLPLRRDFITGDEHRRPPLSQLRPRAGLNAVQLKTYLLVLLMAAYPKRGRGRLHEAPYYPPDTYAKALDLPEVRPQSPKGERRIRAAVGKLEHPLGLLQAGRVGQTGPRTYLQPLREDGSGKRYRNPAGIDFPPEHAYDPEGEFVQVGHELFRNGWLSVLTGAALSTWLILLHRKPSDSEWVFVPPTERTARYQISDDTFLQGLRELKAHRLVHRQTRSTQVGKSPFSWKRQENIKLLADRLHEQPARAIIPGITTEPGE